MKKLVLLIAMMLAIAGVVDAQVNYTVQTRLQKDYFKVELSITSGIAPFDVIFNGRHVGFYGMYGAYDTINILTVRDANNSEKTDTIYETNPNYTLEIGYYSHQYSGFGDDDIIYQKTGISISSTFNDRENYDVKWYLMGGSQVRIGTGMVYMGSNDSVVAYLRYPADEPPVGIYALEVLDTVKRLSTVVFLTIIDPSDTSTIDTTTNDTSNLGNNVIDADDNIVYPNPTRNFISFSRPVDYAEIWSSDGKHVKIYKRINYIDISYFPKGIYYVRIGKSVKKILKM